MSANRKRPYGKCLALACSVLGTQQAMAQSAPLAPGQPASVHGAMSFTNAAVPLVGASVAAGLVGIILGNQTATSTTTTKASSALTVGGAAGVSAAQGSGGNGSGGSIGSGGTITNSGGGAGFYGAVDGVVSNSGTVTGRNGSGVYVSGGGTIINFGSITNGTYYSPSGTGGSLFSGGSSSSTTGTH